MENQSIENAWDRVQRDMTPAAAPPDMARTQPPDPQALMNNYEKAREQILKENEGK